MSGVIIPANPFTGKATTIKRTANYTVPADKVAQVISIKGGINLNGNYIYGAAKVIPFFPDVIPAGEPLAPQLAIGANPQYNIRNATKYANIPYVNMFSTGYAYQGSVDYTDRATLLRLAPSSIYLAQGAPLGTGGTVEHRFFTNLTGYEITIRVFTNVQSENALDYITIAHKDISGTNINTYTSQSLGPGNNAVNKPAVTNDRNAYPDLLSAIAPQIGDYGRIDTFTMQPEEYLWREDWVHNDDGVNATNQERGVVHWLYTVTPDINDPVWVGPGTLIEVNDSVDSEYIIMEFDLP